MVFFFMVGLFGVVELEVAEVEFDGEAEGDEGKADPAADT